jgi:hypothetical protein
VETLCQLPRLHCPLRPAISKPRLLQPLSVNIFPCMWKTKKVKYNWRSGWYLNRNFPNTSQILSQLHPRRHSEMQIIF